MQADTVRNLGDFLILCSITNELRNQDDSCEILAVTILEPTEDDLRAYRQFGINILPPVFSKTLSLLSRIRRRTLAGLIHVLLVFACEVLYVEMLCWACGRNTSRSASSNRHISTLMAIRDADAVISVGGDHFVSDTGASFGLIRALLEIRLARKMRNPAIMFGQSFGPIHQKWLRTLVRRELSKAAMIVPREEESLRFLKTIGLGPNITIGADASFLLFKPELWFSEEQHAFKGGLRVGIAPRRYTFSRDEREQRYQEELYIKKLAEFADSVALHGNNKIVFIAQNESEHESDSAMIDKIRRSMRQGASVVPNSVPSSMVELLERYACLDFLVTTRMHAGLCALLRGIPFVVIGYRPKCRGIMKMLGVERYLVDIRSFSSEDLHKLLAEMKSEYAVYRRQIQNGGLKARKLARSSLEAGLKRVLQSKIRR